MISHGVLYIVPTPIGNLGDITYRGVEVLKSVYAILAEDTRVTRKLLNHFDISTPLWSFHQFNEHQKVESVITTLESGQSLALVSDAGTPGISDPAYLLTTACLEHNIPFQTLPGATALIPALVNAALPTHQFCFEGFLPHKKGRLKRLEQLSTEERTMVIYESPHRIAKTLLQLVTHLGSERRCAVSRELSKKFETIYHGTLEELAQKATESKWKGEMVIVVEGRKIRS